MANKAKKYVYSFGGGKAEGKTEMKNLLGGKGANLAEMSNLGLPVPPGFTISTEVCTYYYAHKKKYPITLSKEVDNAIAKVEKLMKSKFGSDKDPLLVSVRSGARISMPGMMDTVLNLGLNDKAVEGLSKKTNNARFAWDAYRRFIQMFGNVVMGIDSEHFEVLLDKVKKSVKAEFDTDLTTDDLKEVVKQYKKLFKKETKINFPQDAKKQLWYAITAVFGSWNNTRAIKYRKLNNIPGHWGTAVNVQTMVFGNMGDNSGTGVAFTRDPSTGKNKFYGEYLLNAQGEDVVAGIRTPKPISTLNRKNPKVYKQLVAIYKKLEKHYKDMQDMEFTIQEGKLYMLQTRTGKRTAAAAIKIAVDMVKERLINKSTAVSRIQPEQLDQLLHPTFDLKEKKKANIIAKGLPASPGAAVGKVVFTADEAEALGRKGEKVILVRTETSPEDIGGMAAAQAILTAKGGMTSHAAVVARGMGKCCVAGCGAINIDYKTKKFTVGNLTIKQGDIISLDGSTGEVIKGEVKTIIPKLTGNFRKIMKWADNIRKLKVRTNADTPKDSQVAIDFGAEGIGLCRTEHMFFEGDRIDYVRQMILAEDQKGREKALSKLLPFQKKDFIGIFNAMKNRPVTIRLLDPPLHEFLPHNKKEVSALAKQMKVSPSKLQAKVNSLHEFNPMLGHRGCRLGLVYPEIYKMQVQAIFEAACEVSKKLKIKIKPEVMIPLISTVKELAILKEDAIQVAQEVMKKKKMKLNYLVGTMIELPRAALIADKVAEVAEFFSYGTNDLTQTTFGLSRDDAGTFLPFYVEKGVIDNDPFQVLDRDGVGELVKIGIKKGRSVKKSLKIGICGEHGGEPASVKFCHQAGMDYVSCSPYRVPIARLAAAHAVLEDRKK